MGFVGDNEEEVGVPIDIDVCDVGGPTNNGFAILHFENHSILVLKVGIDLVGIVGGEVSIFELDGVAVGAAKI